MKRTTGLLLLTLLATSPAFAQGRLNGRILDASGTVLPGVTVVASNGNPQRRVTDASGSYEFSDLPAGSYTVTASLSGFATGKREAIVVADGRATTVDFTLCVGAVADILFVTHGDLRRMFRAADMVAYVRISDTRPMNECPSSGVMHSADVIEMLKAGPFQPSLPTLDFVQERSLQEPTPYRIGQKMVVFLTSRKDGSFLRDGGPFGVFLIDGEDVRGTGSRKTDATSTTAFLAKLRTLAEGEKR